MILGVYPYMRFNGNAKEAVSFYKDVFDAELIGIQTYADLHEKLDSPVADEMKDFVSHAQLKIGETMLMLSDSLPDKDHGTSTQLNIAVLLANTTKTKEVFEKLKENGQVILPLQETPFSPAYAQVKDKYDITWQLSTIVE